jgi:hypothetical protein
MVFAGVVLICTMPASAGLVGTTTDPTGVTGLVVGSNIYDVTFSVDYFDNVYPSGPQFSSFGAAGNVSTALANFLNSAGVTGLGGFDCATLANVDHQGGCSIMFPYPTVAGWQISTVNASWFYWQGDPSAVPPLPPFSDTQFNQSYTYINLANPQAGVNAFGNNFTYAEWASVTLTGTVAPEPASTFLFAAGLGLVSLARRRRKK